MRRTTVYTALALVAGVACTEIPYEDTRPPLRTFAVQVSPSSPLGTRESPLPFPSAEPARVELTLEALDEQGALLADFNGAARITVVPGEVDATQRRVRFVDGRATTTAEFRFSYGETRIWVEDSGEDLATDCANGLDDDLDGVSDAADPDCQQPEGRLASARATLAVGLSPSMFFAEPRIHDVQSSPRCTTDSPLGGQNVTIDQGQSARLVVTGTTQSGLYVTDLSGPASGYNAVFLFTFSNPGGVKPGDRLCSIAGNVAEFIGNSQLNFPSFVNGDPTRGIAGEAQGVVPCRPNEPDLAGADAVPPPHVLTASDVTGENASPPADFYRVCGPGDTVIPGLDDPTDCAAARAALPADVRRSSPIDCARDNFAMEPWEHSLVAFENVTLGTRFEDCDTNGDGFIARDPGNAEGLCEEACTADPLCTVDVSLEKFGQFAAGVDCTPAPTASPDAAPTSGFVCAAKIFISTRDTLGKSGYDILQHKGERLARIVGHLRQTQPGAGVDTIWIVEPRAIEDFVSAVEAP